MLHANGFNGGTYAPLLSLLQPASWLAMDFRGHGQSFTPPRITSWSNFMQDVVRTRDAKMFSRPIAIGHSLGGVTALMTEAHHPGMFRGIVLLDPVIFSPRMVAFFGLMQLPGMARLLNPLAKASRARRMEFPSRDAVVDSYRTKKTFASWQEAFLRAYIEWGTLENGDGVRLACAGETEAQIFSTWPLAFWFWIHRVKCPVLILRGATSDTFRPEAANRLKAKLNHAELKTVPGAGHFLPMEQPEAVAELISKWEHSKVQS